MNKLLRRHSNTSGKTIGFDEVKDPCSSLYYTEGGTDAPAGAIPSDFRGKIINLYCMKRRCEEELEMLSQEMERLENFLVSKIEMVESAVQTLASDTDRFSSGMRSMVLNIRAATLKELVVLQKKWGAEFEFKRNYMELCNTPMTSATTSSWPACEQSLADIES